MPFKEKEYNRVYQFQIREKRKKAGVCSIDGVGRPVRPGGVCQSCLDHSRWVLRDLKTRVIAGYGGACACCGIAIYEFLSIDHTMERGADERKRMGGRYINSVSLYRRILREGFPPNYQLLCYNCNCSLGFFGFCPHRPDIRRVVYKNKT